MQPFCLQVYMYCCFTSQTVNTIFAIFVKYLIINQASLCLFQKGVSPLAITKAHSCNHHQLLLLSRYPCDLKIDGCMQSYVKVLLFQISALS